MAGFAGLVTFVMCGERCLTIAFPQHPEPNKQGVSMRGLLSTVITRPIHRLTIAGAVGTLVATTAFASNRSEPARLDGADLALENARILLGAPVCA
jgi:hypothetical protein